MVTEGVLELWGSEEPQSQGAGGRRCRSVVLHDFLDPVHIFAYIGVDAWDAFLPTRPHGPPGHQPLKDSSAHQGAPGVTLGKKGKVHGLNMRRI